MSDWILFCLVPAVPFVIGLINLLTWSRGGAHAAPAPGIGVLIPARNEERNIEAALASVLAQDPLRTGLLGSVVVYDDGSTDGTAAIVNRVAQGDNRVRLVSGKPLPPGWVGKPHACHCLFEETTEEQLLFMDADIRLESGALARLSSFSVKNRPADVVTAVPRQVSGTFVERLVLPLLHLTYIAWLPLFLVSRGRQRSTVAANGQLLFVSRKVCEALGGFSHVKSEIVDDVAFCRWAKESGYRVEFVDGHRMARCRMYEGPREVWRGFSKNLFEGIGGNLLSLAFVMCLYFLCFVSPYLGMALGIFMSDPTLIAASSAGVAMNIVLRAGLSVRFGCGLTGLLLHPVSVIVLLAIAFNSFLWARRDDIRWAGRSYPARQRRRLESPRDLESSQGAAPSLVPERAQP